MSSSKMLAALNSQVQAELYSEYIYLSMASWLDSENLKGFAHFFKVQASEERAHAMKIYDFINDIGGKVNLEALDKPKSKYTGVIEIFEDALAHEKYITGRINDLVKLAKEENDYKTENFLRWFLEEQIEEEDLMLSSLDKVKAFATNKGQLYLLDAKMGERK